MRYARRYLGPFAAFLVVAAVITALAWQNITKVDDTAPPKPPCGAPIYKPDGTQWICTFDDEFDGTTLDPTKWLPQTDFLSGNPRVAVACYVNDPSVISVSGGYLHLTVRKTTQMRTCMGVKKPTPYIAGMVTTYQRFSQQYGRFEIRIKNTASLVPGLHEAFWMWPDNRYTKLNWPLTGELDVVETYSLWPHLALPFLHYGASDNDGNIPGVNTQWNCRAERGVWNTYTVVWDRDALRILVNGKTCLVNTAHPVAFAERYIIDLTTALGESKNALTPQTPLPATTLIDYVRVWK